MRAYMDLRKGRRHDRSEDPEVWGTEASVRRVLFPVAQMRLERGRDGGARGTRRPKRLREDETGASGVITIIMLFATMVILLQSVMTVWVPEEGEALEAQHLRGVQMDMMDLKEMVHLVSSQEVAAGKISVGISLGPDGTELPGVMIAGGALDFASPGREASSPRMVVYPSETPADILSAGAGSLDYISDHLYQSKQDINYELGGVLRSDGFDGSAVLAGPFTEMEKGSDGISVKLTLPTLEGEAQRTAGRSVAVAELTCTEAPVVSRYQWPETINLTFHVLSPRSVGWTGHFHNVAETAELAFDPTMYINGSKGSVLRLKDMIDDAKAAGTMTPVAAADLKTRGVTCDALLDKAQAAVDARDLDDFHKALKGLRSEMDNAERTVRSYLADSQLSDTDVGKTLTRTYDAMFTDASWAESLTAGRVDWYEGDYAVHSYYSEADLDLIGVEALESASTVFDLELIQ